MGIKKRDILADTPVNTGRQIEVDIAKATMLLMLPFIHCIIECSTDAQFDYGLSFLFDTVIGGPFSAPMYLFAMGIGMVYSHRVNTIDRVKRGLMLIGIFYIAQTFRYLIPYLIGYGITGDREQFIDPLIYRWLGCDVLLFAGMAIIVIALFIHLGFSERMMIEISVCLLLITNLIGDIDTGSGAGNIFLGYFIGTTDAEEMVISDYPLLTWLIIPVCGYAFGKVLIRVKNKDRFYGILTIPMLVIPALCYPILNYYEMGVFDYGENAYYHMMAWDCVWYLCLNVGMLGLWHFLSKNMGEGFRAFFSETSRNITSFYCIHWVFVICITNVILYIINGTQVFPIPYVLLIALGIDIVTWFIAHYWAIWKKSRATGLTKLQSK